MNKIDLKKVAVHWAAMTTPSKQIQIKQIHYHGQENERRFVLIF